MKLANYICNGSTSAALVRDGKAYEISTSARRIGLEQLAKVNSVDDILSQSLLDILQNNEEDLISSSDGIQVKDLRLRSPLLRPPKIFLAAVNYLSHGKEQGVEPPAEPYFFTKFQNTIIGPEDPIPIPRISKKVDWEGELAVVIGKRGKYIPESVAREHIAGYTISNDVSFRDLQFLNGWPARPNPLGHNWVKGKGLDSALPIGPWLVTTEEINDPYKLDISLSVNGETRQKSNTSEMVFKAESMIEYLSAGITLEPGDIISTGTPLGVAAFTSVPYLKDGDIVEAAISRIGVLRNPVRAEI